MLSNGLKRTVDLKEHKMKQDTFFDCHDDTNASWSSIQNYSKAKLDWMEF